MAYNSNPFLERMSERTTSDNEFVRLFSPKILERLPNEVFNSGLHVFRSPPGGGKTTLLRVFTPAALRSFWHAKKSEAMEDAYRRLVELEIIDETEGPQTLGVLLSCASGYADLPSGANFADQGLFRALLNCRIVLRALRNLAALYGTSPQESLAGISLDYDETCRDLKMIPLLNNAAELTVWAEQAERSVYAHLDAIIAPKDGVLPSHVRFEGVLWLQGVRFLKDGKRIAERRMLMIDDLHKLRRQQRQLLAEEITELRPSMPVWLAERSIALGEQLLSQGARSGRDLHAVDLIDEIWGSGKGSQQFLAYAQNILDRRMDRQTTIPSGSFAQHLRSDILPNEVSEQVQRGVVRFNEQTDRFRSNPQYAEWFGRAEQLSAKPSLNSLRELYKIQIQIARQDRKRQMTFELAPLPTAELDERGSSKEDNAADIFMHEDLRIPYYYGIERLCTLATNNVEELLGLAAALYEGLKAKQVLRREAVLSPNEQEKYLVDAAKHKRSFIPKSHTEGTRAQQLIDGIASYCRERTFLPNAPYAPGVTGVRLTKGDIDALEEGRSYGDSGRILHRVLCECVAENLFTTKESASSNSRESGLVFNLNRTLCALNGLPLGYGGWQDVDVQDMIGWMQRGPSFSRKRHLEID
jgi:hypothetical protein